MPEGKKYTQSQELNTPSSSSSSVYKETTTSSKATKESPLNPLDTPSPLPSIESSSVDPATPVIANDLADSTVRKSKYSTFFIYFSEWRHFKTLLGTASCWFLLDIAFYGTNLNQSVLLTDIGFSTGKNEYDVLMRNAIGNLIIAVSGYVPGYFFTIYFIEKLGRRWIQIQGFLICALMFAILAGGNTHLGTAGKFVCFTIAQVRRLCSFFKAFLLRTFPNIELSITDPWQFFFNFGPNATTFIIPAEVFPSRVRGLGHGVSAAVGKMGAILSALLFNYLSGPQSIGLPNVLWIFFACSILGAISTFILIPETKGKDSDVLDFEEWQQSQGKETHEDEKV
jgi:MFS transporter, PHS family, inorganic phosphate transporter